DWYLAHDRAPLPHLFRVLWLFWGLRDHLGEARGWIDQLLPAADSMEPDAQAELLWTATTRRRWPAASASNRCSPRSATPICMWCPSWPWRGSRRSSATSTAPCGK